MDLLSKLSLDRTGRASGRFLLVLALGLGAIAARAADLYVPSASYPTIQFAINAAAPSGDTIHVAAGTYPGGIVWNAKSLTLKGAGAGLSVIDDAWCLSLSDVPATARIEGFTLRRGVTVNTRSSPTMTDCIVTQSTENGMRNEYQSYPTLIRCAFIDVTAQVRQEEERG